jgi:kynurenine formamidase
MDESLAGVGLREIGRRVSNWGRWGDDDQLGTLNFVTPEKRIEAAQLVKTGKIFDLGMAFDEHGPQGRGALKRFNPIHVMTMTPQDEFNPDDDLLLADDMIIMGLQSSTQWDALAHVGYDGLLYNNTPPRSVDGRFGATRLSFACCIERLTSRGVLLDIPRLKGVNRLAESTEITPQDLTDAAHKQGVSVTRGDILLIRTGDYQHFLEGNNGRYLGPEPGLAVECAQWMHEHEVAAVAMDNFSVDVLPATRGTLIPFHKVAIRDMGMTLGEMFNLEHLAEDCDQDGRWDFFFTGTGLKISNSVGSPVTPLALK